MNNTALDKGNGGVIQLRRDGIQTFSPAVGAMNSTTVAFTVGARIYQKITLAEATISNVQNCWWCSV